MNIFPNPASNSTVHIRTEGDVINSRIAQLSVYDAYGKLIDSNRLEVGHGDNLWELEVGNWPSGAYQISITNNQQRAIRTLIVIK